MCRVNILDAYNNNNLQYTMETRLKKLETKLEINELEINLVINWK